MVYLTLVLKVFIIEYFILFIHEFIHYIYSLFLGLRVNNFHLIPFTIYKKNSKFTFKINILEDNFTTSRLDFNAINLSSKLEYNILLKKLLIYFWIGPLFDFITFILLFCIGVSNISFSYLILVSLIHFSISTINFFNSDGKYAIGIKEDSKIAFDVVRNFTLCGNGSVSSKTKSIMTDIHMDISKNTSIEPFDVNDLWNFLNNISFYTNSLLSYLNHDIHNLDYTTINFFNTLEQDFYVIKKYDYRQLEKTSISLLYYFIYKKILNNTFTPDENISIEMLNYLNNYYKKLYTLYFHDKVENIDFLLDKSNMPTFISTREGYSKLLLNLINIYKKQK